MCFAKGTPTEGCVRKREGQGRRPGCFPSACDSLDHLMRSEILSSFINGSAKVKESEGTFLRSHYYVVVGLDVSPHSSSGFLDAHTHAESRHCSRTRGESYCSGIGNHTGDGQSLQSKWPELLPFLRSNAKDYKRGNKGQLFKSCQYQHLVFLQTFPHML